jgi:hypothetical protein
MITSRHLAHLSKTVIVLPFLLAMLLGFSFHANAASHTAVSTGYHVTADVTDPPPGH